VQITDNFHLSNTITEQDGGFVACGRRDVSDQTVRTEQGATREEAERLRGHRAEAPNAKQAHNAVPEDVSVERAAPLLDPVSNLSSEVGYRV
jgi:hypothetical protein